MKKLVSIYLCLIFFTIGFIQAKSYSKEESTYQGKPTSYWIKMVKDKDEQFRKDAAEALKKIGLKAIPMILREMKDVDLEDNMKAYDTYIGVIVYIGEDSVPYIINNLDNEESLFCTLGVLFAIIQEKNVNATEAVPALKKALKNKNDRIRGFAAGILVKIGPPANKLAVPVLIEMLKKDDEFIKREACMSLAEVGPEAKEAVPLLIEEMNDENENVRFWAIVALQGIGPEAKDAVPALIVALKDKHGASRERAVRCLGEIGPDAKEAVPALTEIFKKDEFIYIREFAAEALKKIGGS